MLTKRELRKNIPPIRGRLAPALEVIRMWEAAKRPESVFCYLSTKGEYQTAPIVCYCISKGIPLAVPLCETGGIMTAREIFGLNNLRRGKFGTLEPNANAPLLTDIDDVIVPGFLFDKSGFRLGRGGGYYDRWLANRNNYRRSIGLCGQERIVGALPKAEWDVGVDIIAMGEVRTYAKG